MEPYENLLLEGEKVKLVQRNNAIDISRILLDTSPEILHNHLENVLRFESTQLFSSSESSVEQDGEDNISSPFSPFLPFIFPDSVLSTIFSFLDVKDLESLEMSSKSWKIALKKGFLAELEKEWLAPVKSRKMIEELTTAFGSSMLRYGYEWKQLWKYLESVKEKIGLMEALHEQMIGLIGFSHFSLISDTNDPEFATYQKSIVEWMRIASNTMIDALLEHRKESISLISGSGLPIAPSLDQVTSVEEAIRFRAQEMVKREEEAIVALMKQIDTLLTRWASSYCQTLVKTHLIPAIADHKEIKQLETEKTNRNSNHSLRLSTASNEDHISSQNALFDNDIQFMGDLLEIWRKVRCWEGVLSSLASPFASRLISAPIDFPSLFGLELFNPKRAIRKYLLEMLWTDDTKSTVFTICMDVCDRLTEIQQNSSTGDQIGYLDSALSTLLELKPFFQTVSEPALADMVSRYNTGATSTPGNSFRLISRRYVWIQTRDGANLRILVSHALRFSTLSSAVERSLSIGSAFGDDDLDELIELGDLMVLKDDFHALLLFSSFMDSLPSEYLAQATTRNPDEAVQSKYAEEGIEAPAEFILPFLTSPRTFAALLLASRQLGFDFLTKTLESLLTNASSDD